LRLYSVGSSQPEDFFLKTKNCHCYPIGPRLGSYGIAPPILAWRPPCQSKLVCGNAHQSSGMSTPCRLVCTPARQSFLACDYQAPEKRPFFAADILTNTKLSGRQRWINSKGQVTSHVIHLGNISAHLRTSKMIVSGCYIWNYIRYYTNKNWDCMYQNWYYMYLKWYWIYHERYYIRPTYSIS
jgi:hypothetical protein